MYLQFYFCSFIAQANGKYYWYAELHSLSLDDKVYSRFLNYLSEKELVSLGFILASNQQVTTPINWTSYLEFYLIILGPNCALKYM